MVAKPLAPLDIQAGKKFVELLRRPQGTEVPVNLQAAAWLYTEWKDDWRLYLVSTLVDTKSGIYANLVIFDAMLKHSEFNVLQRRVEIVGRHDRYAEWLGQLRPVGDAKKLGDIQIDSNPAEEGVLAAYIYLSM
jgi:hypothetical protein